MEASAVIASEKQKVSTGGRPSKYNEQMLERAHEYLAPYNTDEGLAVCEIGFPTIEGLTVHLGVN
ncbi:MAG: DNA-packaging protein, partial [bacterium]|nr:DNA-packaging protein [bacterium]